MSKEYVYVPVVENEALDISEDIAHISIAKRSIDALSTSVLSKDDKWEVLNLLNSYERKLRSVLRQEYLTGDGKHVYASLRDRLKYELEKELSSKGVTKL
jgi:hypothetical protein